MSASRTGVRLQGHTLCVPVSFESNEQVDIRVPFCGRVRINRVLAIVVKALAGTDDGFIAIKSDDGLTTFATIDLPLSSALGVTQAFANANAQLSGDSLFSPDKVLVLDGKTLLISGTKSTAGGK